MALLNLLLKTENFSKIEFPLTEGLTVMNFDVCSEVIHDMDSSLTNNPIEDGSDITDHVNLKNKKATFDIIISDTPIGTIKSLATGLITSVISDRIKKSPLLVLGGAKIAGLVLDRTFKRAQESFSLLEKLRDNRTLIDAILGFRKYKNAIITSLRITQNSRNIGSLNARMTIEEVKIVQTETIKVTNDNVDKSVEGSATNEVNTGKQSIKSVSEKTSRDVGSFLFELIY